MSYAVSASITARLKPGVTAAQLHEVLSPLSLYYGVDPWTASDLADYTARREGSQLTVRCGGDVGYSFEDAFRQCCTALAVYTQAGQSRFFNESEWTVPDFGFFGDDTSAVRRLQRVAAQALLDEAGFTDICIT